MPVRQRGEGEAVLRDEAMTIVEDCRLWADRFRREVASLVELDLHTGEATSELVEQHLEESSIYARAADEIERLHTEIERLHTEVERLRAELHRIADLDTSTNGRAGSAILRDLARRALQS